jgi:signal transduction histidine kinase
MKLKNSPLQRKLMSVMLLTSAVVLLLMCTAYMVLEYSSYRQTEKSQIATLGSVVARNSTAALAFKSVSDAVEILNALKAEKSIAVACLYDQDGKIFAKYPADTTDAVFPAIPQHRGYHFESKYLSGFQEVKQDNQELGVLYIKSDLAAMYAQLRHYALIGLALIIGSMLIAYALSKVLQKSISDPILALEQTAKTISEKHDYSVRAVKFSNDEVGSLTDAFNRMLLQIQAQNQEITSFNQNLEQKINERTNDLKQQKEFVETIINSSVDLIIVFDKDLNYSMLNKRALQYIGIDDFQSKNLLDVFPHMKDSEMHNGLKTALTGVAVHHPNYKSPVMNRYFENYFIPLLNADNEVYGVVTIGHDITGIIEANEKLVVVNAELMKSNRDLEQFAYIASHDLQEPLRKIQTFSMLMEQHLNDKESLSRYLQKVQQSALRMQHLIQDVLNFSRISNSQEAFIKTDLNRMLEQLKSDYELVLREKEAMIIYDVLPEVPGIPLQLSQLFANLISNSIKYTERKPVIQITAHQLSSEEQEQHPKLKKDITYIKILFADNGIGFEPQYEDQVFAIFERLHGRQSYNGTGIGLALCRKIVENHQGIIYAKGNPGKGAVFTIILPA